MKISKLIFRRFLLAVCFAACVISTNGQTFGTTRNDAMKQNDVKPPLRQLSPEEEQHLDYEHDFIDGVKMKLFGNLPDAANLLTTCTEVDSSDAAAYFALSEIYLEHDNANETMKNARLAVRYDPTNIWYKRRLSALYTAIHQTDSAVLVYKDIVALQPNDIDNMMQLASLYRQNQQYKQALKELRKVERVYGFSPEIALERYQVYVHKGDVKATEKQLLKSIDAFPDEMRFYGLLAEFYSAVGRKQEAQDYFQKLLNADPENAMGYMALIEFYRDYGNDEKALNEMERMIDLKTINPELKAELLIETSRDTIFAREHSVRLDSMAAQLGYLYPDNFRVRMLNADLHLRQNNFRAAREDLLFITDRVSTSAFLWERLLLVLNVLQDHQGLYDASGKALEIFPDNYIFTFFRAFSSYILKKPDEAIDAFNRTLKNIEKTKDHDREIEVQSLAVLAELYNDKKQYEESDILFEQALLLAPNNPMILNNYSYYLSVRNQKLDVAERCIKKCLSIEPNNGTYLDTYGWVLYRLGHYDEAIAKLREALKNGSEDDADVMEHLCEALNKVGKTDEANDVCKKAEKLKGSE